LKVLISIHLIKDLVGNDQKLRKQLISILINSKNDMKNAETFINIFNSDLLKEMPVSTQEFYHNNINNIKIEENHLNLEDQNFFKLDIGLENIIFVNNENKFKHMINYFQTTHVDIVGRSVYFN